MLVRMADKARVQEGRGTVDDQLARGRQRLIEQAQAELDAWESPSAGPSMATWQQRARATVRRAGHNRGAARDVLIDLFARQRCALSVREIEDALVHGRPVGRASVYRALELLQDLKLIERVDVGDGIMRYERSQEAHDFHHHHMVCERCGLVMAFDDQQLEQAIHGLGERVGFIISGHEVTLRGICIECS